MDWSRLLIQLECARTAYRPASITLGRCQVSDWAMRLLHQQHRAGLAHGGILGSFCSHVVASAHRSCTEGLLILVEEKVSNANVWLRQKNGRNI